MEKEKNLELERLIFFSDAVVAIAITLLALDLHVTKNDNGPLLFSDLAAEWTRFLAFLLSFVLIAIYWKIHHSFFSLINKMDNTLFWYNMLWLLSIILIPFSTRLLSLYFDQTPSLFVYSMNTLLVTFCQNQIWDYAAVRPHYLNDKATAPVIRDYRFDCNTAMINAVIAVALSFISPIAGFVVLCCRPLMMGVLKRVFLRKTD